MSLYDNETAEYFMEVKVKCADRRSNRDNVVDVIDPQSIEEKCISSNYFEDLDLYPFTTCKRDDQESSEDIGEEEECVFDDSD